ncbi:2Fe-2S iron-sulfur cluster-binding protein [Streptomyces sp. NPDC058371]|uniref:2Fe-2S iron-sulfur cluster-binding protein n=1 Tax=Streptomyces sp. NPDC058371 TaxID=3346463 RepID=UPI00364B90F7
MTDDQHGEGAPRGGTHGAWERLPQGDYDDGATAFVKLPEGGIDALLADRDSPLAAPGHGYVPPQITVAPASSAGTDPAATGSWAVPAEGVQWPDPNGAAGEAAPDGFGYQQGATGQWTFADADGSHASGGSHAPGGAYGQGASGHDVTGQWSIPVANGDLPDESGEFTTSALVEQWGGTPPATLPGGAAAPWATETIGQPWSAGPERHPDAPSDGHAGAPAGLPGRLPNGAGGGRATGPSDGAYADATAQAAQEASERVHGAAEAAEAAGAEPDGYGPGADDHDGYDSGTDEPDAYDATDEADGYDSGTDEPADDGDEAGQAAEPDAAAAEFPEDTPEDENAAHPAAAHNEHPMASYVLRVNGADRPVTDAWIGESLLYVLRERLGLAGAKDGCSQGECGACNVQVDGRLVASCLVPAVTAAGSEVRTVEGLATEGQPSDVQRALAKCGAVQCGFCVPGMAMTVHDLLEGNPAPTELETRQALCGNLCRCSGYRGVLNAVREVVAEREAHHAAADPAADGDEARIPHQAGPGAGGVNPSAFDSPGPHDQPYGQDGGQA